MRRVEGKSPFLRFLERQNEERVGRIFLLKHFNQILYVAVQERFFSYLQIAQWLCLMMIMLLSAFRDPWRMTLFCLPDMIPAKPKAVPDITLVLVLVCFSLHDD